MPTEDSKLNATDGLDDQDLQHLDLSRENIALVVIDMQNDFLAEGGFLHKMASGRKQKKKEQKLKPLALGTDIVPRIAELAARCRRHGGSVVWITSVYGEWRLKGLPKPKPQPLLPKKQDIAQGRTGNDTLHAGTHCGKKCCERDSWGACMFAPMAEAVDSSTDVFVEKHYYSAFTDTSLHALLNERKTSSVLFCGVTANMCVQASATDACLLGFKVAVPWDCTWASSSTAKSKARRALRRQGALIVRDGTSICLGDDPNVNRRMVSPTTSTCKTACLCACV
mmetsp:Transcript_12494/g.23761  ORF Transcript_12494/g.23761 Transcript_12494/m.23761 type:complete len:282 (-) Transcript_12494:160-1005(-)